MHVLSWNFNSFTHERNWEKIALLAQQRWSVAMLQEVTARTHAQILDELECDGLSSLDLEIETTHDVPLGVTILSRIGPLTDPEALPALLRPERFIAATVSTSKGPIRVASWHAPNVPGDGADNKMAAYSILAEWAATQTIPVILGVDMNSGNESRDPADLDPDDQWYPERRFFQDPLAHRLRDAFQIWLDDHPSNREQILARRPEGPLAITYARGTGNKPIAERFDRIWVTDGWRVESFTHEYAEAIAAGSDHALLVAEVVQPGVEAADVLPIAQPDRWEGRIGLMLAEMNSLIAEGRWVRGHVDLLSVIWSGRNELAHSRILGWLLDPLGAHGLGAALLNRLCDHVGMAPPIDIRRTWVQLERGHHELGRADIIVELEAGRRIVIENKVDAHEQPDQARRMVAAFDDVDEAAFVYLTLHGGLPSTAGETLDRWTGLSHAQIGEWVEDALGHAAPDAAPSVASYVATITEHLS